jgi:hypothetical protein
VSSKRHVVRNIIVYLPADVDSKTKQSGNLSIILFPLDSVHVDGNFKWCETGRINDQGHKNEMISRSTETLLDMPQHKLAPV